MVGVKRGVEFFALWFGFEANGKVAVGEEGVRAGGAHSEVQSDRVGVWW